VKNIFSLIEYLTYLINAEGAQGIHSPFVFELYNKVIKGPDIYYEFSAIEQLRKRLLHSTEVVHVTDFGAGNNQKQERKVSDIVRHSAISPEKGRLLFRLVNFLQPKNIVELGTSLGISTLYQHKANPGAELITMEGSPELSELAGTNFKILKAQSIKRVVGDFAQTLPQVIDTLNFVDYVFFDGNHRKEATLEYFKQFLPITSEKCVFVFDDIRWSKGMQKAWQEIIKEPTATVTIDLFSFGLVFFIPTQEKQHFTVRY
jgi:predicted O-methyltransferase YrrM